VGNLCHQELLLPPNIRSCSWWHGKGKGFLARGKKPVSEADSVSQTFLFLCGGVDIREKIICSDSILTSLTLLVIADDYLFLQRESGVGLYFSFLKTNFCLQWGGLSSPLVITPTLQKLTCLVAHSLSRFNKSVPVFG